MCVNLEKVWKTKPFTDLFKETYESLRDWLLCRVNDDRSETLLPIAPYQTLSTNGTLHTKSV